MKSILTLILFCSLTALAQIPPATLQWMEMAATPKAAASGGDITIGLVGWWKLIETSGSTANDSSGNGNTGTMVGSPTWESPGVQLNGTNQYVVLARNNGLPLYSTAASNNLTVSLWVYLENTSSEQEFYGEGGNGGTGRFTVDFNNSANPGRISIWLPATYSPDMLNGDTTLSLNTWYNIVWTDNDGTAQLYINDSPDGANFNYTPEVSGATSGAAIGAVYNGQAEDTYGFTHGIISNVQLWNRGLSPTEILTVFNNGH